MVRDFRWFLSIGGVIKSIKLHVPKRPVIKRKYDEGRRQLLTVRLPESLLKRLQRDLKEKGYSLTEIVEIVLDMYLQQQD